MNINQQAEIEELFRRINKSIQKNNKSKINDEDLNKVRAYVVQSRWQQQQRLSLLAMIKQPSFQAVINLFA